MAALPSALSLTNIADGANIVAVDHRNNYSNVQTAVNALILALNQGTAGQLYSSDAAGNVVMVNAPGKQAWVGNPTVDTAVVVAWPGANKAVLVPFSLNTTQTIDRVHLKPTNLSGNFDVGIYDSSGTRQVSKGSTAQSTLTNAAINEVTFGATATLAAGLYYLALAADNTTGTFLFESAIASAMFKYQRVVSTAFPLPASLTVGTTAPTAALLLSAPAS